MLHCWMIWLKKPRGGADVALEEPVAGPSAGRAKEL